MVSNLPNTSTCSDLFRRIGQLSALHVTIHVLLFMDRELFRRSGWGLVSSVIWPFFLMFSVKMGKILMLSV